MSPIPAGFKNREGDYGVRWDPKIGDTIQGRIIAYRVEVGEANDKGERSDCMTLAVDDGNVKAAIWISANLEGRITKADEGKEVYIERVADTPPTKGGRSAMKTYLIGVK